MPRNIYIWNYARNQEHHLRPRRGDHQPGQPAHRGRIHIVRRKKFQGLFRTWLCRFFFKDYEVGKISDQQFVDSLKELTGLSVPDEKIIDGWNALLLDFPPERIQLLRDLAKRYRVFLFSNTNALHLASLQQTYRDTIGNGELDDLFEKAYYSHLLGMRKPGKESFEHILRENQLIEAETLFVDDALVNVEGAEAAGLKGLYLRPGLTITEVEW